MGDIDRRDVDLVMQALPPQARIALDALSELQKRPAEDVLRDEIAKYIAGRLRRMSREFGED